MESFLESVADSVSQLVLFSIEESKDVKEDACVIEGAKLVEHCVSGMQNLASKVESELFTPQMEKKLGQSHKDVREGIAKIISNAQILAKDFVNTEAKQGLLEGSKTLLKNMVTCLQLTDLHECGYLIKKCEEIVAQLEQLRTISTRTHSVTEFRILVPQLIENVILLRKATYQRIQVISQPRYKSLLKEASTTIANNIEEIIHKSAACVKDKENSKEEETHRQNTEHQLLRALDDITFVAQESPKGLFDNLWSDLNITLFDQGKTLSEFESTSNKDDLNTSVPMTITILDHLLECIKKNDKQNAIEYLKEIRQFLQLIQPKLTHECVSINDLVSLCKACLLSPANENTAQELIAVVHKLQIALRILLERANLPTEITPELRQSIHAKIEQFEEVCDILSQSVFLSDQPKAIQTAKEALQLLNDASELAAGLAERLDNDDLHLYFTKSRTVLVNAMPALLEKTKSALLDSTNRREFIIAKEVALFAIQSLLPPINLVHPELQVLEYTKALHSHLLQLQRYLAADNHSQTHEGIHSFVKEIVRATRENVQAIKVFIDRGEHSDKLQQACFALTNEHVQSLVKSALEEPLTHSILSEIRTKIDPTLLANSEILCHIFPDLPTRLQQNQNVLQKELDALRVRESEYTSKQYRLLTNLVNEQTVNALALSQISNDGRKRDQLVTIHKLLAHLLLVLSDSDSSIDRDFVIAKLDEILLAHQQLAEPAEIDSNSNALLKKLAELNPRSDSLASKLYAAARVIALELSKLASDTTASELIIAVRKISQQAHVMVKLSQEFARICYDKRLGEQLCLKVSSARTKSVQLKILCAVKAASCNVGGVINFANEDQLIGCVAGLTKDVEATVSAVEVAKIRS